MTYEKRGSVIASDFFNSLSTAESDEFLAQYNAARNDAEQAAVIRRWMTGKRETRKKVRIRTSGRTAKANANASKLRDVLVDKLLDPIEIDIANKHRELLGKRDWD